MGRSAIHGVREDGKTFCGQFIAKEVFHLSSSLRPVADDPFAVRLGVAITCRNCLKVVKR